MLSLRIQHVQKHPFSKILAFPFQLALLWLWLDQAVQGNQLLYPFCWGCMILSQVCFACWSHSGQLMLCISDAPDEELGFLCLRSWCDCSTDGPCFPLGHIVTLLWRLHNFAFLIHPYVFVLSFSFQLFSVLASTHLTSLFLNLRYYHCWWLRYPSVKSTVVQDKDWNSKSGKEKKNIWVNEGTLCDQLAVPHVSSF